MSVDYTISTLIEILLENQCTDLRLKANEVPQVGTKDEMNELELDPLSKEDAETLVRSICNDEQWDEVNDNGEAKFLYYCGENDSVCFRVSARREIGLYALTMQVYVPLEYDMDSLMNLMVEDGCSDLHIEVGSAPRMRDKGALTEVADLAPLSPEDTEILVRSICNAKQWNEIQKDGTTDFGLAFSNKARFRVSAFKQRGVYGTIMRQIPNKLMTLQQIGLTEDVKEILKRPRGLILVTGPTGSGKSTTLASMLDIINQEDTCHIITVEDPIEFYHYHKKACVIQREVGVDVPSFAEALRRALRQDPDVILVGEMRDLETISAAITAAETGHLVFGTLHTTGATRTVDRIVDAFPTNQQEQVRTQLAETIVAVISQSLLPRADKPGRVAAFEIMYATPAIKALIRENKSYRITSEIQTGAKYGMFTLDNHLSDLFRRGIISKDELLKKCQDPQAIKQEFKFED